ncbi:MAG: phenylalanine--tRNA ligase subunit beta [Patescibacteria group bacterium]
MKFSYNWLKELTSIKKSPDETAELLNMRAFEVERVEKVGNDFTLDAKVPVNRISDAGNHQGLAKEIAALLGLKVKKHSMGAFVSTPQAQTLKIKIASPELCPRYTAVILNLKKNDVSPPWMQKRLATCGFRPINAIVDATNYVMLETGQPLHAFDLDKIEGGRMNIRESKEGETLTTLDGTTHILPQGTIVIEDAERLIDLAGIMGGQNSAVSDGTKRILLQAAAFDPVRIYRATRALNFSSDAAKIYAAGTDPNKTMGALRRATDILLQMDVVDVPQGWIDLYPKKTAQTKIAFRPAYADKVIGEPLGHQFHQKAFERFGFKKRAGGKDKWLIEVPTERRDLHQEEDLIEESARMYGYERLASKLPESHLIPAPKNDAVWWEHQIADHLAGAGFTETQLYEFTGDHELDQFGIDRARVIALENPMNPETRYLVPRAAIKSVSSAADNLRHFDAVKLFGISKSFRKDPLEERKDLVICLAAKGTSGEEEFYLLKGAVEQMLESMGISDQWYDDAIDETRATYHDTRIFHPYRRAEIKMGDEKIGVIGEIHPDILKKIKSKGRIAAAEIDMEKLARLATSEAEYRPIGKYPAMIRDIAVVVPRDTRTQEVENIISAAGGELLADTDLFDYFQDENLQESEEKSLAFHLVFQSAERTLMDAEADAVMQRIVSALEEKNWEVKK